VDFRLLGPFEVESDGRDLTPVRQKHRLLLAALVLRANEVVATDDLVEILWGPSPPATAHKALHGHVSALRKLLGPEKIETRPPGYLLHADPGSIDARRFEDLVEAAGEETHPARRRDLLRAALALFRGEPLAEFRYEPFARDEAARLEGLRLRALEDRIDAELQLGRDRELIPELEQLVAEHPYEERPRAALMLALYRAGRQTQALETYADARRRLVDELGIEPGPILQRLERQILNQDPALEPTSAPGRAEPALTELPLPPTQLIGRERELAEIRSLLDRTRLLTLTGVAGIGKTRLALAAAAELPDRFPGGAVFAGLAPIADAELVLPAIAQALGIKESGARTLAEALTAALANSSPLLLVLDNCEHVLDAASALAQLLGAAPALTVLATSREPLHLVYERVYAVPPLRNEEAIPLFAERAEAVKPDFRRTDANDPVVGEICRRLDGLPLAIELAAARVVLFPPAALLARLDQRLSLLTRGGRDQPERHQTLRAAIDWSHDLLPEPHQALLARLSVFVSGWTLEAAEAVCDGHLDIVDGLASLIDKNLIGLGGTDQEPRFAMLETIREYAAERLDESGETEELKRRHAEHFLAVAEAAEPKVRTYVREWLDRLESDNDNLLAAFDRLTDAGETDDALRLGGAVADFWGIRGNLTDCLRRLERALAADGCPTAARAKALIGAADLSAGAGDTATAHTKAEEALSIGRSLGDAWGTARSLFVLGTLAADERDFVRAHQLAEESVRLFREAGDEFFALSASRILAQTYEGLGDRERAQVLREDSLRRARSLGNAFAQAYALDALAVAAIDEARPEDAVALLEETYRLQVELGDRYRIAVAVSRFAAILASVERAEVAARVLASSEALLEESGGRPPWIARMNEETLSRVLAGLDEAAFAAAWEEGQALTADEAVALVFDSLPERASAVRR
jgi:predicted ATPase/DNA-binding SARP family transcriptional activator